MPSAWVVPSPGSVEAAAAEPVCDVDGWQLHLPVPYHDGGDDVCETSASSHGDQGW